MAVLATIGSLYRGHWLQMPGNSAWLQNSSSSSYHSFLAQSVDLISLILSILSFLNRSEWYWYIYICSPPPWSTPMIPNEGLTLSFPMAHLWPLCRLCKTLLVLSHKMVDFTWRCRKKRWQDGKKQGRNKCSKHLSCRKCYKKMLLTDYNLPWRQDIPSNKEILFLQESYHVWKDAIHALMKLSLPLISLVWPWFSAFWWSRGNRVRIMRWSNIFKIQWLYLYYSFNISLIYHSIDCENIVKRPLMCLLCLLNTM